MNNLILSRSAIEGSQRESLLRKIPFLVTKTDRFYGTMINPVPDTFRAREQYFWVGKL